MIAFCAASKRNPKQLWLFSLSPYFSEDLPKQKKSHLAAIGHRRVSAFNEIYFSKLIKNIKCRTLIFLGDLEANKFPDIYNRSIGTSKHIKKSNLILVSDTDHDVSSTNYIKCIVDNI